MSAEPLNVRVARALDWTNVQSIGVRGGVEKWVGIAPGDSQAFVCGRCAGKGEVRICDIFLCDTCHGTGHLAMYKAIPPFGDPSPEGWSATGPLMDKFDIDLIRATESFSAAPVQYIAATPNGEGMERGDTRAQAVCELVCALASAGRLKG